MANVTSARDKSIVNSDNDSAGLFLPSVKIENKVE